MLGAKKHQTSTLVPSIKEVLSDSLANGIEFSIPFSGQSMCKIRLAAHQIIVEKGEEANIC